MTPFICNSEADKSNLWWKQSNSSCLDGAVWGAWLGRGHKRTFSEAMKMFPMVSPTFYEMHQEIRQINAGLLNLSTHKLRSWVILCGGPVLWNVRSWAAFGLYPLDAKSTPPPEWPNVPWGQSQHPHPHPTPTPVGNCCIKGKDGWILYMIKQI